MPALCLCQECGKSFTTKPSRIKKGWGKFCSRPCKHKNKTISTQGICQNPHCGKLFKVFPSHTKKNGGKFCSQACSGKYRSIPIEIRFYQYVQVCIHGNDCPYCCHEWQGSIDKQGYGHINCYYEIRITTAHRAAWELHNKKRLSKGLQSCHYCHNRSCVNFDHLHPGTQKENNADSIRDGRIRHKPNGQFVKLLKNPS